MEKSEKLLLKPLEAAELLGFGRSKIYELLAMGELPSIRIDGSVRIPTYALRRWIRQRLKEANRERQRERER